MDEPSFVMQLTRTTQIVVAALALGSLTMGTMFTVVLKSKNENNLMLTLTAVGVGAVLAAMRVLVPPLLAVAVRRNLGRVREREDEDRRKLAQAYFQSTVVAGALLEAGVMLNLVVHHLTGHVGNAVAAALMFVAIPLLIPSVNQVEDWIETQLRLSRE